MTFICYLRNKNDVWTVFETRQATRTDFFGTYTLPSHVFYNPHRSRICCKSVTYFVFKDMKEKNNMKMMESIFVEYQTSRWF